jgi:hypothetical protein
MQQQAQQSLQSQSQGSGGRKVEQGLMIWKQKGMFEKSSQGSIVDFQKSLGHTNKLVPQVAPQSAQSTANSIQSPQLISVNGKSVPQIAPQNIQHSTGSESSPTVIAAIQTVPQLAASQTVPQQVAPTKAPVLHLDDGVLTLSSMSLSEPDPFRDYVLSIGAYTVIKKNSTRIK